MMDKDRKNPVILELVSNNGDGLVFRADDFKVRGFNESLLPQSKDTQLIFLKFSEISGSDFLSLMTHTEPCAVVDFRNAPTFNKDILTRKNTFNAFNKYRTRYLDIAGRLDLLALNHYLNMPNELLRFTNDLLRKFKKPGTGSILLLMDDSNFTKVYIETLSKIELPGGKKWGVKNYPILTDEKKKKFIEPVDLGNEKQNLNHNRNILFISHANPEDNDFVLWVSARLKMLGYAVWSDEESLLCGELFWEKIESVIRYDAVKVLFVYSKNSLNRPNVENEIDLALSVERKLNINNFVLPLKIDGTDFDSIYIGLRRRFILDFNGNWAAGLHSLLDKLNKDDVPRLSNNNSPFGSIEIQNSTEKLGLKNESELLISNWYQMKYPDYIYFYSHKKEETGNIKIKLLENDVSFCLHKEFLISFSDERKVKGVLSDEIQSLKLESIHDTNSFLNGIENDILKIHANETGKIAISLLQREWDTFMKQKGLNSYELSSGAKSWFYKNDWLESNKAEYIDEDGKKRFRKIVGYSERQKLFWHLAIEGRPHIGKRPHYSIKTHVVFTQDGINPIPSKIQLHKLRRSFCKNWWNDRWRDLFRSFLSSIFNEAHGGTAYFGNSCKIHINTQPIKMKCPVSMADAVTSHNTGEEFEYDEDLEPIDSELIGWEDESFDIG